MKNLTSLPKNSSISSFFAYGSGLDLSAFFLLSLAALLAWVSAGDDDWLLADLVLTTSFPPTPRNSLAFLGAELGEVDPRRGGLES
jgi:hypothetical protein